MGWTTKTKRKNPDLPQLLDFDDTDLKANRAGILSQRQMRRLRRGYVWWVIFCLPAGVFGVIMAGMVVVSTLQIILGFMGLTWGGDWGNPWVRLFVAMVFCWDIHRHFQRELRQYREIRAGKISEIRGTLHKEQRPTRRGQQWFIQVAGEDFFIPPQQAILFQAGSEYILYYLPLNRHIVAVEHLPAENPS